MLFTQVSNVLFRGRLPKVLFLERREAQFEQLLLLAYLEGTFVSMNISLQEDERILHLTYSLKCGREILCLHLYNK